MIEHLLARYFHYFVFFLLILLLFALWRVDFHKDLLGTIKHNRFFFLVLLIAGLSIPPLLSDIKPLAYFDEQEYLIQAQNLREEGVSSLCNTRLDGECQQFLIAPHGQGVSAIYSLFYHADFDRFYRTVALLCQFLYILNSILVFMIANRAFRNKIVSLFSASLTLVLPYNLIFSMSAMPETISSTFFLLSVYHSLDILTLYHRGQNIAGHLFAVPFIALSILVTLRIEYAALLSGLIFFIFWCRHQGRISGPEKHLDAFTFLFLNASVAITAVYFFFHAKIKLFSADPSPGPAFGFEHANLSYATYFFSDPLFSILTASALFYLVRLFFIEKKEKRVEKTIALMLVGILLGYVLIYSFYNYPSVYRFLIPVSSLYLLLASAGMDVILGEIAKKRVVRYTVLMTIVLLSVLYLIPIASEKRSHLLDTKEKDAFFLEMLGGTLATLQENDHDTVVFFVPSAMGQVADLDNYIQDQNRAVEMLKAGKTILYMNSPFESFEESTLHDYEKTSHRLLFNDTQHGYHIYTLQKRVRADGQI